MKSIIRSGFALSMLLLVSSCLSFDNPISIKAKEVNPLNVPQGADAAIITISENLTLQSINGEECLISGTAAFPALPGVYSFSVKYFTATYGYYTTEYSSTDETPFYNVVIESGKTYQFYYTRSDRIISFYFSESLEGYKGMYPSQKTYKQPASDDLLASDFAGNFFVKLAGNKLQFTDLDSRKKETAATGVSGLTAVKAVGSGIYLFDKYNNVYEYNRDSETSSLLFNLETEPLDIQVFSGYIAVKSSETSVLFYDTKGNLQNKYDFDKTILNIKGNRKSGHLCLVFADELKVYSADGSLFSSVNLGTLLRGEKILDGDFNAERNKAAAITPSGSVYVMTENGGRWETEYNLFERDNQTYREFPRQPKKVLFTSNGDYLVIADDNFVYSMSTPVYAAVYDLRESPEAIFVSRGPYGEYLFLKCSGTAALLGGNLAISDDDRYIAVFRKSAIAKEVFIYDMDDFFDLK